MRTRVGVIFGGETVEHEVSIISAVQAMNHIDEDKYEIVPIYISKNRTWYTGGMLRNIEVFSDFENLKRYARKVNLQRRDDSFYLQSLGFFKRIVKEIDVAIPIVHGNQTEDGSLQGYLETLGIPYAGSKVLGSALGQDKIVMKQVLKAEGIPVVPYVWFYDNEYLLDRKSKLAKIKSLGYPVVVKPASLGSSVGISFVKNEIEIENAIEDAMKYDNKIIVEKAVSNLIEVNISVLGNSVTQELSALEEVMGSEEFLSYRDKYLGGKKGSKSKGMVNTNRIIPARVSKEIKAEIEDNAKKVFKALNLSGVCRIDFLVDSKTKEVFVNEPNTIPGSLSFYLWEPIGKKYTVLLDDMINLAIKDYKEKRKKIFSFDTNILSGFHGSKGAKGSKTKL